MNQNIYTSLYIDYILFKLAVFSESIFKVVLTLIVYHKSLIIQYKHIFCDYFESHLMNNGSSTTK